MLDGLLFQTACVFGAAILGPLVSIAALVVLLRRHSRNAGPLFRIEHVGGVTAIPVGPYPGGAVGATLPDGFQQATAARIPGGARTLPVEEVAEPASEETGELFELGPTYEEEQRLKATQEREQEQAVLHQLFEQNLRLQEELARSRQSAD